MSTRLEKLRITQGLTNSLGFGLIFAFGEFLLSAYLRLGQFIILPFTVATVLAGDMLAWYDAHKSGYKKGPLFNAILRGITGLGMSLGMLGGLIAAAAFAFVGPILGIVSTGTRSLYFSISAIYYGLNYLNNKDESTKAKAIGNAVSALTTALNVIALGLVMIAMKASFGILGIVANVIPMVFILYQAFKNRSAAKTPATADNTAAVKQPLMQKAAQEKQLTHGDGLKLVAKKAEASKAGFFSGFRRARQPSPTVTHTPSLQLSPT